MNVLIASGDLLLIAVDFGEMAGFEPDMRGMFCFVPFVILENIRRPAY